ncbi:tRNA (adenosine(37)-N6)-threonylcarbamoyltransferase complex dimerization subunit type 1 TsaB [Bartonella sp. F02]|uniref:tRNA (adenosine(37)-N6)-threonylcarbamoyltransferase complex dimerization subunit type 1 TsaB n=1 Tax=Bartonella sp. F02 TaxID=2967262 RepID=UPI0022A8FCB6|nr:tRNA (adenosine(37)-N6)-threonylcarbamoyltransferase complex dimerization subunit type 1 TsaB [Bartonella sp. F02]MCZ2328069.1 tRNA (adenosine(37)-N6)-threonylcarbamoyltransferase complex dimerization subunit type 1 TsaB [Bartonella sp. F02]
MLILTIDTASIYCTAALIHNKSVIACISERMKKGHAEKLIGQITEVTEQANITLDQIDRIAVNIGPGSFTGIRVGVSTARALALALEIPAIGVSALEALAKQAALQNISSNITVAIEAGRGMFYHQDFNKNLITLNAPGLKTLENIIENLPQKTTLTGPATDLIALHLKNNTTNKILEFNQIPYEAANIEIYAYLAAEKQSQMSPRPLYLRNADAKKQTNFAIPRKQS